MRRPLIIKSFDNFYFLSLQEHEKKVVPWLYCFAVFGVLRFLGWLFFSIVNDLIFAYNIIMVFLWAVFCICNVYSWIIVYSLYLELSDLTKLEDLAHLRVRLMFQFSRIILCFSLSWLQ